MIKKIGILDMPKKALLLRLKIFENFSFPYRPRGSREQPFQTFHPSLGNENIVNYLTLISKNLTGGSKVPDGRTKHFKARLVHSFHTSTGL